MIGMTNSALNFGSKVASGLGSSLLGWVLALGAYNANLSAQPQNALNAILSGW